MKLTGLFKRGAACLCTAAILMGGVSAFALTPALPDEPAPAELSVTNAVSEAQLRSALSKLTVTYDSEAEGWQIDSPYEEASMEKASCGLYPYLFVTNDDPTVYLSLGMTYFGNKKLDMKFFWGKKRGKPPTSPFLKRVHRRLHNNHPKGWCAAGCFVRGAPAPGERGWRPPRPPPPPPPPQPPPPPHPHPNPKNPPPPPHPPATPPPPPPSSFFPLPRGFLAG